MRRYIAFDRLATDINRAHAIDRYADTLVGISPDRTGASDIDRSVFGFQLLQIDVTRAFDAGADVMHLATGMNAARTCDARIEGRAGQAGGFEITGASMDTPLSAGPVATMWMA